jgi:hypothetical protein
MAGTVQALVFEWVLTNGSLPGFVDRVNATKHLWPKTPEPQRIVWRGQGKVKPGIPQRAPPDSLRSDVRPVISTSEDKASAAVFGGDDCCLYQIVVKPGVRYLNVEKVGAGYIPDDVVNYVKSLIPEDRKGFTSRATPNMKFISAFKTRIEKEHEILLECGGIFTDPVSFSDSVPKEFHTSYQMKAGGRRRTRRTVKIIRMKKGEYLREHHHLFRVLRNPTRRALNAELRAQKRELKERGLRG